jgi:hydroxymethylbilane synthase
MKDDPILIATRGSALALAQANLVLKACRKKFPSLVFELRIIKTTGDKLQTASLMKSDPTLPRGLFTKELEEALLDRKADLAVHSLKDLPTELPSGLTLAGVAGKRADVRDVLLYRAEGGAIRGFEPGLFLAEFPKGITVATSSSRRKAQLLAARPDFNVVEIRGNVPTRIQKLAHQPEIDATVLAAAGLERLDFTLDDGRLRGDGIPDGLLALALGLDQMLPCVGQGAIGIETRENDERIAKICEQLGHEETLQSVIAERAFLRAMGGGCQTPVAAYASVEKKHLRLRAISFMSAPPRRADATDVPANAVALGEKVAASIKG